MTDPELLAWLRLLLTPGLGRAPARRLLAAVGSAEELTALHAEALRQLLGPNLARAWDDHEAPASEAARLTATWLAEDARRAVVSLGDARYPEALLHTEDPPLLLFVHGRLELLKRDSLAIVGSRHPTPQGLDHAREFAAHLSRAGLTIVSGLALGIDGAAHAGALLGDGSTVAVVGTGLDRVYPRRHLDLAHRIAQHGLMVSEFPLGTPPLAANFPMRNRIIAGLTRGTLVVEATLQSGSLITARLAVEAGREVMAIPGSIHAPQSRGCHALIKQGAKLVESSDDVLAELERPPRPAPGGLPADVVDDAPTPDPILVAMGHEPATLDALLGRTGWPVHELSAHLLELELDGRVQRLPGGLFQQRRPT